MDGWMMERLYIGVYLMFSSLLEIEGLMFVCWLLGEPY
jgi:hypothetical protein